VYGAGISENVAGESASRILEPSVESGARTALAQAVRIGGQAGVSVLDKKQPVPEWAKMATFDGPTSGACPLCAYLVGQTVKVNSSDYNKYAPPIHINCRHYWTYSNVEVEPMFVPPSDETIRKHGHFITAPEKYRLLRIPANPSGRNFVFNRNTSHPLSGREANSMEWLKRPENALPRDAMADLRLAADADGPVKFPLEWLDSPAARTGTYGQLQQAGYIQVRRVMGEVETITVTRDTAEDAIAWVRGQYGDADIVGTQSVQTQIAGESDTFIVQQQISFRKHDQIEVRPTRWGKLALEGEDQ